MSKSSFLPANRLWMYRMRMAFGQKYVALLLGHRRASLISRYEKNVTLPSLMTVLKLSAIFRVPVEFLYHDLFEKLRSEIRAKEEAQRSTSA